MAFIKIQKLRFDDQGRIVSGSAAVMASEYVRGKQHHSRQVLRERLGKVIWLAEDRKSGIFLLPTRGLVEFDVREQTFASVDRQDVRILDSPRLAGEADVRPEADTNRSCMDGDIGQVRIFGDAHWLLEFLAQSHYAETLARVFPEHDVRARLLLHLVHAVLRLGENISCENFAALSLVSWVFPEIDLSSPAREAAFFETLGDGERRRAFFRAHVAAMRRKGKRFGKECACEDVLSLPHVAGCPLDRLGTGASAGSFPDPDSVPRRLVVVTDSTLGHVVWFEAVPDGSTLLPVLFDVAEHLGCGTGSLALSAGHVPQTLPALLAWQGNGLRGRRCAGKPAETFVALLPRTGECRFTDLVARARQAASEQEGEALVVYGSPYTGVPLDVSLFGSPLHARVYLARDRDREPLPSILPCEWEEALRHMDSLCWYADNGKDFVLVGNGGNSDASPARLLEHWLAAVTRERVLKNTEGFGALSEDCWSHKAIMGKLLLDSLCANVVRDVQRLLEQAPPLSRDLEDMASPDMALEDMAGRLQSLMAVRSARDIVRVEEPGDDVREYYGLLGCRVPGFVDLPRLRSKLGF